MPFSLITHEMFLSIIFLLLYPIVIKDSHKLSNGVIVTYKKNLLSLGHILYSDLGLQEKYLKENSLSVVLWTS